MNGTWEACINLECMHRNGKTVLTENEHHGPLMVQKVFYPEKTAHIYLLHPPGGIAGCDHLQTTLKAGVNSHVLLTTPGAAKFYRTTNELTSLVTQHYTVESGATLEILPQPNIYFKGTHTRVFTQIHTASDGRFFFWDMAVCGNPSDGADFSDSGFLNSISVFREHSGHDVQEGNDSSLADARKDARYRESRGEGGGKSGGASSDFGGGVNGVEPFTNKAKASSELLLREVSRVDGNRDLKALAGLNNCQCMATVVAYPATPLVLEIARSVLADFRELAGATLIGELLVIRLLEASNEPLEQIVTKLWLRLRPQIIGLEPVIPRVWAT